MPKPDNASASRQAHRSAPAGNKRPRADAARAAKPAPKPKRARVSQAKAAKRSTRTANANRNGQRPKPTGLASRAVRELGTIEVTGAREHNLKNVSVSIPKRKLVVFTGVSGSGKSSLAFDTLYAEGQRRYVESLSAYARQFLDLMEKPKYETIRGLSPTISIEQKAASKNPRSTVGTITEIYDYLRVLFARIGVQHCHLCGRVVGRGDAPSIVREILALTQGATCLLLAPIVQNRKGEHKDVLDDLRAQGLVRARVDGVVTRLEDVQALSRQQKHTIEAVISRFTVAPRLKTRLTQDVELALKLGRGTLIVHAPGARGGRDRTFSEHRTCCGVSFPKLDPPQFSFNAPQGMCPECHGLGAKDAVDPDRLVPDKSLTIRQGAVRPWRRRFETNGQSDRWGWAMLKAMEREWGFDWDTPWKKLKKRQRQTILFGSEDELRVRWRRRKGSGSFTTTYPGLVATITRRWIESPGERTCREYSQYVRRLPCPSCRGERLRAESAAVKVGERGIIELTRLTVAAAHAWARELKLSGPQKTIGVELLKEIVARLRFLENVGLDYLTLDRAGPTLSGGEAQRIRLASQIGSELTGVIYVLDEPSIGLHQRDNARLLGTLEHLRDIGNTLIVVEHDRETIERADWVVDFGPGAGHLGGEVVFSGTPRALIRKSGSLTGAYLAGKRRIEVPEARRQPGAAWVRITGARENNLKNLDARLPLGLFTAVTGVSGAGKSTLVNQILYPAAARALSGGTKPVGAHTAITGLEQLNKVIDIDQQPIGRTPRSNPATYTKVFDEIRAFFARLPEARARGYKPGRFSFNVAGGRCEACAGAGANLIEMHFLADVYVTCEACRGRRFNEATCEVTYRGQSIADLLDRSVAEARELFAAHPKIARILDTLMDVGLGYVKLGQPSTTLSGGEAQRIKLARELAKRATGRTLYILDEPTTGLHFDDIKKLLAVLDRLVEQGNTVVVIEHNLDVIKCADWIIDLGPEGGEAGGRIIATGHPEDIVRVRQSSTGHWLKPLIGRRLKTRPLTPPPST